MNWREQPSELVGIVEKVAVGAARWSEQIPAHDQDRVILRDGECKLLNEYIASLIDRLQQADDRINQLIDDMEPFKPITPPAAVGRHAATGV